MLTKPLSLVFMATIVLGCIENPNQPAANEAEPQSIIRNLPTQDREFLLEPLEAALSDVRNIIDADQSYFSSERKIETETEKGVLKFKLDGKDTVMIEAEITTSSTREKYQRYWDDKGVMFIAEGMIANLDSQGKPVQSRAYLCYYEGKNQRLSAYTKVAFSGGELPKEWVTDCLTDSEERYLLRNWR